METILHILLYIASAGTIATLFIVTIGVIIWLIAKLILLLR